MDDYNPLISVDEYHFDLLTPVFELDYETRETQAEGLTLFLEELCRDVDSTLGSPHDYNPDKSQIYDPKYISVLNQAVQVLTEERNNSQRMQYFRGISIKTLRDFLNGELVVNVEETNLGENFHYGPHRLEFYVGAFYLYIQSLIAEERSVGKWTIDNYEDDFGSEVLYYYIRSKVCLLQAETDDYYEAIEYATKCVEVDPRNHYFLLLQAKALRMYCFTSEEEIDIADLPTDRDELLQFAANQVERAELLNPDWIKAYSEWSHILQLQQEYEEAEKKLIKAIQINQQQREVPNQEWHSDASLRIRNLRRERQHVQRTQEHIEDTRDEIEDLQDEISASRNQTIRFIGFFAGIIAIVVSTAPIASNASSVSQASQIILVLTGGLIIAFVGLGAVFSNSKGDLWRLIIVALFGFSLLGIGLFASLIL